MDSFTNAGFSFEVSDTPAAGDGGAGDGGAGQVAVLLHGFPEDRHSWDGVVPALAAAGYRVLAPDQRGYSPGARPAARSAYTLPRLAEDVLALADAAGAERFHLVGHDWGAGLAWYVAATHPDRLISLTSLSVPHPAAFSKAVTSSDQAARSWYMAAFQVPWVPELVLSRGRGEAMRNLLIRARLDPDSAARYAARAAVPGAMRGPLNWYRALPLGLREHIGRVKVPTLFVWSDGDRFVTRTAADLCRRYVTGPYRFEVFEGASHWLPEEVPERVAAALLEHFASAPGAGPADGAGTTHGAGTTDGA
ncbi:alpha/beta fold hydrolase [Rugosimonospora africana]|uniref:Putative hydrolase n=1 Tax=Rugosimonospora africana TaxID=556532 RepID=A0A8J3VQD8_9ACTN|nr:alpha/beta fold hydrolase [Rugosimonospora africana]GIH14351.1 putative hydrolase [Rugosimonospora africana]